MQFNLNRLISELEQCKNKNSYVTFDFGENPQFFCSWRGSYNYPALVWGESTIGDDVDINSIKLGEFIEMCKETIGKEFQGWKGGEFIMDGMDRLWICKKRNYSGNLGICGVTDNDYDVILHTEYCTY